MYAGRKILLTSLMGTALLPAHATDFLVGQGPGCQFNTIQAAVNAAAANPGADTVRIANAGTYFAEAVTIGAQDLIIDGGFAACADTAPSGVRATISGQGGAAAPVFSITGSAANRRFKNLAIVRGDQSATGKGGGINFDGAGALTLSNVTMGSNVAGFGGAINFNGPANAVLTLENDTVLQLNQAITGGGGGIRIEGDAKLFIIEPRVLISLNTAAEDGGGLAVLDDVVAIVASAGFGSGGVIADNTAANGGGVAVIGDNAEERPVLLMYSTDANAPVRLQNNRASSKGGAIYARPVRPFLGGTESIPRICLLSFHLSGNRAQEGAAIYGDTDSAAGDFEGSEIFLNAGTCGATAANAQACTRNQNGCNVIENHVSETAAGVATQGATVLLQDDGTLRIKDVIFFFNRGGSLIRTIEQRNFLLQNSLLVGNAVGGSLIRINAMSFDEGAVIQHNTIASNTIVGAQVVQFEDGPDRLKFNHNLIFQPGKTSVTLPFAIANSAVTSWDHNATSDTSQILPPPLQVINVEPRFNSAALGDFRLRIGSRLVDQFPNIASDNIVSRDLDDRVRPVDLEIISNRTIDVGAYERQATDPWLLNGNFDGNLNYWPSDNPGLTSFSTLNSPGNPGGSIAFARAATVGATVPAYNAGVQCFNVPGPGVYRLSGAGRGSATSFSDGDSPYIFWRVRSNSADCVQAAPVALEGNLLLPDQSAFAQVSTPAEIVIPAGIWTPNTTIELRLDVRVTPIDGAISAGFDNIRITGMSTDRLFANGFE
jgi:predicted outer membrane repeat protein